jgi:hypothetical protein
MMKIISYSWKLSNTCRAFLDYFDKRKLITRAKREFNKINFYNLEIIAPIITRELERSESYYRF